MRGKLEKIVMIGPVYPYKGGISHYTGFMFKELSKNYEVEMISFKLQYPKFIFKKEQKDFGNDSFKIENTNFLINTVNPFNWIHVAKKIKRMAPDLIIIPWWHPYFAPFYWSLSKMLKKIKIMFLCHNVFPHERFVLDRFLTKRVLKQGDYFIVQSKEDAKDLKSVIINPNYRLTVLPTYNAFKLCQMTKEEARKQLNLSQTEKVLLFFGFVREYKGLQYLIKALPEVSQRYEELKLLIVGDFGSDKEEYMKLIEEYRMISYIQVYDNYIPDKEVQKFFTASDLVVLPYTSATQSAIVQTAYGFEIPVIATNVGGLPEVVIDNKTGYVVEPKNSIQLSKAIERYFDEKKEKEFIGNIRSESYKYSWERIVEVVLSLYEKV